MHENSLPQPWWLLELRAGIRMVDTELIALLARRFTLMREIRRFKEGSDLPSHDPRRERDVLAHCLALAADLDVPANVVRSLYERLFEAARGSALTDIKAPAPAGSQNFTQAPDGSGGFSRKG